MEDINQEKRPKIDVPQDATWIDRSKNCEDGHAWTIGATDPGTGLISLICPNCDTGLSVSEDSQMYKDVSLGEDGQV